MAHVSHGAKLYLAPLAGFWMFAAACSNGAPVDPRVQAVPIYDPATGRLERLESDRDGDGRVDATAYMHGTSLQYVEIDRDRDGRPDRWEYYIPNPTGVSGPGSPDGRNLLDRAEERTAPDAPVTRRERYAAGIISEVEEDTDLDGRMDKWEYYVQGRLARIELDLAGRGRPDRRLVYDPQGNVVRVEADPDGDGVFIEVKPPA